MTHYYTEPYKANFNWIVEKRDTQGKTLDTFKFNSKPEAVAFLEKKTVTVYVDKVLID